MTPPALLPRVIGLVRRLVLALLCLAAVGCLAGPARQPNASTAPPTRAAKLQGAPDGIRHHVGLHRHAVVDDEDLLRFPGGRITRSLVAQGSHVSVNSGSSAGNDYNCTLRRASSPNIPITLFIGNTVDQVNVGVQIPASASQGGQLDVDRHG